MRLLLLTIFGLAASGHAFAETFSVTSPDIDHGLPAASMILAKSFGLGCDGQNQAPEIHWSGAPAGTLSYLVTLYDEDAPTGIGFMHWVVADIPANITGLSAGSVPAAGVETRTDMGAPGYVGICPPLGKKHTYVLTVRALDIARLPVGPDTTPALVGFMAHDHIVGSASMRFTYGR